MRQFLTITRISLLSFRSRAVPALVIVAGLTCVCVVMLPILSMAEGLRLSYLDAGDPDRALALPAHASAGLTQDGVRRIMKAPGIARADAELVTYAKLTKRAGNGNGYTHLRGFGANGFALRPELKLVSGRLYRPRAHEVLVGVLAARKFAGLAPGNWVTAAGTHWHVVGMYETGGTLDGDLIVDAPLLMRALNRNSYDSVLVRLSSGDVFPAFQQATTRAGAARVLREPDYYRQLWQQVPSTGFVVAYGLGLLIGMGALSGTMHTMHNAVASRAKEIVLLRAIGFDARAVAASVVVEAVALAMLGALIGAGIDWLWLDGYAYNGGIDGGVFKVAMTARLLLIALAWAAVIALLGAQMPARQAARGTVAEALRDL
jgi:putative ABC transport system permease protein